MREKALIIMQRKPMKNITATKLLALFLVAAMTALFPVTSVFGQQVYESAVNGFRITLPAGWVIQDNDVSLNSLGQNVMANTMGFDTVAIACLERNSLPAIGGTVTCEVLEEPGGATVTTSADVQIYRFNNLQTKSEFANVIRQGKAIVPLDILPLHMAAIEKISNLVNGYSTSIHFRVESQQDMNVNVVTPAETPGAIPPATKTIPAKFVELVITVDTGIVTKDVKMFDLLVVSEDQNTGYALVSSRWSPTTTLDAPAPIQQIMTSFELVH
jgi:hypothetical protein